MSFKPGNYVFLVGSDIPAIVVREIWYDSLEYKKYAKRYKEMYDVAPEETIGFTAESDVYYFVRPYGGKLYELAWKSDMMPISKSEFESVTSRGIKF